MKKLLILVCLAALAAGAQEPKASPVAKPVDARKEYETGTRLFGKKEWKPALNHYNNAIKANNGFVKAYVMRGASYFLLEDEPKAISDLDRALELDPENPQGLYARALLYYFKGDAKQAIKDLDRFLKSQTESSRGYLYRAAANYRLGQMKPVLSDASKAIEFAPKTTEAFMLRGAAYMRTGNLDAALQDFDLAIEQQPDVALYQILRYICTFKQGKADKETLSAYAKSAKNRAWPYPAVELMLGRMADPVKLVAQAERDVKPQFKEQARHEAWYFISEYYETIGSKDKAKTYRDQALTNELNRFLAQDYLNKFRFDHIKE